MVFEEVKKESATALLQVRLCRFSGNRCSKQNIRQGTGKEVAQKLKLALVQAKM